MPRGLYTDSAAASNRSTIAAPAWITGGGIAHRGQINARIRCDGGHGGEGRQIEEQEDGSHDVGRGAPARSSTSGRAKFDLLGKRILLTT
jgi:hypothetical protein